MSRGANLLDRHRTIFAALYLAVTTGLNLVWELAQLPLYTIWWQEPLHRRLAAAIHCTAGDLLIAAATLIVAVIVAGRRGPQENYSTVAVIVICLGVVYATFSEWLNAEVRGAWSYAPPMPRLAWIGMGLAPLAQWVVVPTAGFVLLRGMARPNRAG